MGSGANLAYAQGIGNVSVNPTRVVLEGRARSGEATVYNRGNEPATYRIFFREMAMTAEGGLQTLEEVPANYPSASSIIRYSPRQVTLGPGESQTIRLLARKPADLPPGEYRSHLVVQAVPPPDAGQTIESLALEENQIQIQLIPVFGISIPIIVRHGELAATAALSDLAIENTANGPQLNLRIQRDGNKSLYGDIAVTYTNSGSSEFQVGLIRGVGVYTTTDSRNVRLSLQTPSGVSLAAGGKISVTYQTDNGQLLAQASLALR